MGGIFNWSTVCNVLNASMSGTAKKIIKQIKSKKRLASRLSVPTHRTEPRERWGGTGGGTCFYWASESRSALQRDGPFELKSPDVCSPCSSGFLGALKERKQRFLLFFYRHYRICFFTPYYTLNEYLGAFSRKY